MTAALDVATPTTIGDFIAQRGRPVHVAAGEPLFFERDSSHHVYACVAGRIRIFVTLASGKELLMGVKVPGEAFGELSAIDLRPRAASAVAVEDSIVHKMSGEEFLDELEHRPDLALAVLRNLADQLRRTNARLGARNADSTLVRTAQMLVEMASLRLRHGERRERMNLEITHADIADWTGATRESTGRALGRLRRMGVVSTGRGHVTVNDVTELARIIRTA